MNKRSFDQMQQECKSANLKQADKNTHPMIRHCPKNDITQIISKGQAQVSKLLQASPEYIEIIIDYLIHSCMLGLCKIAEVKQYLLSIMSIDNQQLKNAPHARCRCGSKWHGKHVAYRCKTCQITASSCICVDCFNHSNHEGHDYVIYNSELGGCCDCGDELAFKSTGFCTRHSGKMNYNLPDGFREKMYPVLHAVICNFVYYLVHREEYAKSKEILHKLGKWLQKLCATHDGARHLIVEIFLQHSQYAQARMFKADFLNLFISPQQYKIPKAIQEILYKLENERFHHNPLLNDNDINQLQEHKLLKLIKTQINEWRGNIEKRINIVLECIKRGPLWEMHEFVINQPGEQYHGLSHEPRELQILEAPPPRKRGRFHSTQNKLRDDENESDEEDAQTNISLYDSEEHSSECDKNIPINNHNDMDEEIEEPEIIFMDSNDDEMTESDDNTDIDIEDKYYLLKQNTSNDTNDSDIFITKIGKYSLKYSDLNNIKWRDLLPRWLPSYDLEFFHAHIQENFLEDLIRADAHCDNELTKTLTTLFLELMFDKTFKNVFAANFIKYYFIFTHRIMTNPTVLKSLDKITVQILTQKELCHNLVLNHHLMDVLWDSAIFLFSIDCPKRVKLTDITSMIKERHSGHQHVHRMDSSDYWDTDDDISCYQQQQENEYSKTETLIRINLTDRPEYNGLPSIVMDVTAKAFKDKLGRQVLQDIKFMLTHSECVVEMWRSPAIFDKYWYICGLLHGALQHKRLSAALLEPHKPRDREWQHAVAFDMSLSEVNQYIVDGMNAMYDAQACSHIIDLLLAKLKNILCDEPMVMNEYDFLRPPTVIMPWYLAGDIHQNILANCYGTTVAEDEMYGKYRIVDYPVAVHPLSMHIPLHRHLTSYLKLFYDNDPLRFETHLCRFLTLKYSVQLMEHPLRCIVFEIQTHSTLWKRNGLEVSFPLQFYRQPTWHCFSYDLDILLVQLCAMSVASVHNNNSAHIVIESFVHKFNLENYFNFKRLSRKSWKDDIVGLGYLHDEKLTDSEKVMYEIDEWAHYLCEHFFRLIIFLCSPANSVFMNKREMIRREMINNLCACDCSYTCLEDKMSSNLRNEREIFDAILAEIAIYNKPNHNEQGSYTLKLKYWKEFDPFFYHLRPDILTKAKQRNKHKQLTKWKELDAVVQKYGDNNEITHPLYPLVGNILYCNKLHSIIYSVLYTSMHETFYLIRNHYYTKKMSLIQPQRVNNYINSILDEKVCTLQKVMDFDVNNKLFDMVAPENDKSVLNLQNLAPILRVIWLAITTQSTYKENRDKRRAFLNSKAETCAKFIYPFDTLLRDILTDNELITDVYDKEIYPPHFPSIFNKKALDGNKKYLNVNYHDIALCLHPSHDILDNLMVLCDGPLSSLLHLIILLKFTISEHQITFRIDEIVDAISNASTYHQKLVKTATEQIQTFFTERENSTTYSEDCDENKLNYNHSYIKNDTSNINYLLNKKERKKKHKIAKRMAKAKKKQQALLKKFRAKQQKFDPKPTKKQRKTHKIETDSKLSCVICCQGETDESPLGRIVFLQHNLLPKFSRIPDGVADGHIQVLYQYVFDHKIKININELNKVLESHKIIRIEDFACESKENIVKLFKDTFKGRAQENLLEKAAETLHCRAKDLTHAQDRFLGLSHRTPSPVEQLIQLSQRLGGEDAATDMELDAKCTAGQKVSGNTQKNETMEVDNGSEVEVEKKTMRCTTRDYYHTAYSLDIDVDRHRTINFEGDGGVQMLSCGHCLHIECYQRFLAHQMSQQNAQQMHPHLHLLDLQREFFCPLCRRLGNALLPISLCIPDANIKKTEQPENERRSQVLGNIKNKNNLVTSSSLPTMHELANMYVGAHKKQRIAEMPALIRDSIDQLISNITRYSPGMQMIPNSHKSIEWLRFTLLFNIRLLENSLRYDSYRPLHGIIDGNVEDENDYKLVTEHVYKMQKSFLNDSRLETLYLLSRVIIFLSNHNHDDHADNEKESKCADSVQLDRIIRGFFATGWVFDTSPLEIATRVLCMDWEYLPVVAEKFDQLCLTILLTYMGRIIYFLIRWSRATFNDANPHCLRFIKHLSKAHFIRFIHDVNIKRFDRHTAHIRSHKSYEKYLRSELRKNQSNANIPSGEDGKWCEEKILSESKWFLNSIQWFCLPLLRHLAIMKHIIFKLVYKTSDFVEKMEFSADMLSLIGSKKDGLSTMNVTPSGKVVNSDGLILSRLRIIFEYSTWSRYLLLPSIFNILNKKWNATHLGTPYSDKHIVNVCRLSGLQQSQLLFCENPYWDKFIPPELLGIFRAPMSPLPFMLKRLPSLYQTLYTTILYKKCNRCQRVPSEAGLCLTCHRLICFRGDCCKNSKQHTFETYDHMMSCGGGLGGVVHLKMGSILLVAHKRRCLWHSLYLDQHGEEDKWLKRGHPLRISPLRFQELEKMFVDGSFVYHNAQLWVTDAQHY